MIARLPDLLLNAFIVATFGAMVAAAMVGWLDSETCFVDDAENPRACETTK